jgi:hypothetical protein
MLVNFADEWPGFLSDSFLSGCTLLRRRSGGFVSPAPDPLSLAFLGSFLAIATLISPAP